MRHGEERNVLEAQQGMQGLTVNEQELTNRGSSTPLERDTEEQGELVPHTSAPKAQE